MISAKAIGLFFHKGHSDIVTYGNILLVVLIVGNKQLDDIECFQFVLKK